MIPNLFGWLRSWTAGPAISNPATVTMTDHQIHSVAISDRGTTVLMTDRQIGRVTISDRRSI